MSRNDIYDNHSGRVKRRGSRRTGRNRLPAFILVVLISGIVGVAAFLLAKGTEVTAGNDVTPTPAATKIKALEGMILTPAQEMWFSKAEKEMPIITPEPEADDEPEVTQVAAGPFGIWEVSPTPTPVLDPADIVWMADFVDTRTRVDVKGVYVSPDVAAKTASIDSIIELIDQTELNAVVIDVKADNGNITFNMDSDTVKAIGATTNSIPNMASLMKKLKEHGIYTIARVVAFKDPCLAKARPELTFYNNDGTKFYDNSGVAWVSPYKQEVWDYLVEIGLACGKVGFDEVNFDYIRFPTEGVSNINWGEEAETMTKTEAITAFVKYACEKLRYAGLFVSADIFGIVIVSTADAEAVGQSYVDMSRYLDYICPMVYPSHYSFGYAGYDYPDKVPYKIVKLALQGSVKKLSVIKEGHNKAIVRAWLQDFTASYLGSGRYLTYGSEEIRAQIDAVYDSGYSEWLLWNAGGKYTDAGLYYE